jgi:peptide/nickel transport system ATP-binding protein
MSGGKDRRQPLPQAPAAGEVVATGNAGRAERPLLTIHDVSVQDMRRGRIILQNITLHVHAGEIIGIVGESGAGKTTLGLLALGHLRPGLRLMAGHVRLEGLDLFRLPEAQLQALRAARLGLVAQSAAAAFDPAMRLGRQLMESALAHGLADERMGREKALAELELLGLPAPEDMIRRYPHQVSGGQLQRVMAAMATFNEPDLLVLDEPTSALDVQTQIQVLSAIRARLRLAGAAAVFISHDLDVIARMVDRIVILRNGRIVEEGPARAIINAPRHPYTQALWARHRPLPRPRPPAEPVLLATDICAGYRRGEDIIHNVSLTLEKGRTLALVGRSGCGKSTLARAIMGLMPRARGELRLNGEVLPLQLARRKQQARRCLQFVHQAADQSLNPAHDVFTVISRPLRLFRGLSGAALQARVQQLLAQVELEPGLSPQRVRKLSGGQKQRVAIARALAAEPDVLICDEITSALDALLRNEIVSLLRRLQQETGLSLLFITHDMNLVRRIADKVAVMDAGRIIEEGPADDVLRNPATPVTRQLVENLIIPGIPEEPATTSGEGHARAAGG